MKKNEISVLFKQIFTPTSIVVLSFTIIIGMSILGYSIYIDSDALHEVGVIFISIAFSVLVYERILRLHILRETTKVVKEGMHEIINDTMPESYKNLINFGVTNALTNLECEDFKRRLQSNNFEIKIIKFWIPFLNHGVTQNFILDSIKKGNSYKIVLCDPDMKDIIGRRARATGSSLKYEGFRQHIIDSIDFMHEVWLKLSVEDQQKLEIRLHKDFIAASIIGFDDYYLFGLYLNGQLATDGMHYKILKAKNNRNFFSQLDKHFDIQWKEAYRQVEFGSKTWRAVNRDDCMQDNLAILPD